jgi:hypothetical protein
VTARGRRPDDGTGARLAAQPIDTGIESAHRTTSDLQTVSGAARTGVRLATTAMPRCSHIVGASRSGARRHRGERLEPKHWNKPRCAGVVRLSSAAVAAGLLLVHVRHLRESLDYGNYATRAFVCRRRSGRWASEARVRHDARVRRPSRTGVARGPRCTCRPMGGPRPATTINRGGSHRRRRADPVRGKG